MELKQVILVREDLKLPKGKLAAQVAHASVGAVLNSSKQLVKKWDNQGMRKIVLKVKNLKELNKYYNLAQEKGIACALITDAGHTVVKAGTITCLGLGPCAEEKIDTITRTLPML